MTSATLERAELDAMAALVDVDAEQAILNLLLVEGFRSEYDQQTFDVIRRNVDPEDFAPSRPNGLIYRAILEVAEQGGPPEFAAVVSRVPHEHRHYMASLVGGIFLPSYGGPMNCHGGFYAAKVRDLAVKRRAIQALGEAARGFYENRPATEALDEAHRLLDEATSGMRRESGLFDLVDLSQEVDDLYENGGGRGVSTGWSELDPFYRVSPGRWTLVTGIPSHGKSAFVDAMMVNLAQDQGWTFAVCSPENHPLARHVAKLARIWTGKPFDLGPNPRMSYDELVAAKAALHEHFTFVLPHENDRSVRGVLACMEAAAQRRPLNGIVIDPWNELDHSRPSNQTETEFISESLTRIRQFARRYQVHVWLVAHPAKLQRPPGSESYPVPRPYDVSGSAHWFNKADNALAVYRDDADNWVQIHVQKVRFEGDGTRGVAELHYDRLTGRYDGRAAA